MSNVERCRYCGRFMRYEVDAEWGERWVCAEQNGHIIADPEQWSVLTYALREGDVDIYGEPIQIGDMIGAHHLTPEQLHTALGVPYPGDPS